MFKFAFLGKSEAQRLNQHLDTTQICGGTAYLHTGEVPPTDLDRLWNNTGEKWTFVFLNNQ